MHEEHEEYEVKISEAEKSWANAVHLSSILGLCLFVAGLVFVAFEVLIRKNMLSLLVMTVPVIINTVIPILLYKRTKTISNFVKEHARQSLNFQLSVTIYFIISIAAIFVAIGVLLLFVLIIFDISCISDAYRRSREGEGYQYPMSIQFQR